MAEVNTFVVERLARVTELARRLMAHGYRLISFESSGNRLDERGDVIGYPSWYRFRFRHQFAPADNITAREEDICIDYLRGPRQWRPLLGLFEIVPGVGRRRVPFTPFARDFRHLASLRSLAPISLVLPVLI